MNVGDAERLDQEFIDLELAARSISSSSGRALISAMKVLTPALRLGDELDARGPWHVIDRVSCEARTSKSTLGSRFRRI
jgi:hypothetical protein